MHIKKHKKTFFVGNLNQIFAKELRLFFLVLIICENYYNSFNFFRRLKRLVVDVFFTNDYRVIKGKLKIIRMQFLGLNFLM